MYIIKYFLCDNRSSIVDRNQTSNKEQNNTHNIIRIIK